jgi:hypothetical protein
VLEAELVVRYPVIDAPDGIVTVPVNVGLALGAYVVDAVAVVRYDDIPDCV